jgi:hypothetical protein
VVGWSGQVVRALAPSQPPAWRARARSMIPAFHSSSVGLVFFFRTRPVADLAERHQLVEVVLPVPEAALADVVDLETTAGLGLGLLVLLRLPQRVQR